MQLPHIHLNGSNRATLLAQYVAAWEAAQTALKALREIDVHGRDYYPISSDAASTAFAEHQARCKSVETVIDDLYKVAEHLSEAGA